MVDDIDLKLENLFTEYQKNGLKVDDVGTLSEPIKPDKHDHLIDAVVEVIAETKKGGGFTSEMRKKLEDELKRLKGVN